ncbi:hypothetical protein [Pseudomonas prosekii]|uniref:hypothetical protein n=1 Tax=Pseudomonas prosekii TaxID=1148509 RepID=UPI0011EB395B|nr:hypothetical protein [Pseudomonas prosekii]
MTPAQKLAGPVVLILALMAVAAGVARQVQDWRIGKKLAEKLMEQGAAHQKALDAITNEAWRQQKAEQDFPQHKMSAPDYDQTVDRQTSRRHQSEHQAEMQRQAREKAHAVPTDGDSHQPEEPTEGADQQLPNTEQS